MTCAILAFAPATGIGSALDTLCTAAFAQSIGRTYAGLNLQRGLVAISLWFAVVLVVFQVAIPSVYMFIGQREELAMASASYLRILSFGLWPWMAFECLKRYVQANVQMRLPAMVLAVVSPLHLLNHWFFIWRQPDKASFTTVAWITVFSYWAMFLGLVACTLFYDALKPAWRPNDVKSLVATSFYLLAVPAMVEACGEYIAFELMTLLATYLGPVNLAAQAIAFSSMSMLYQLPHAVGGAAAVRIGRLLGEGDKVGARFAAILNQNLESAISLSANFGRISGLWSEFGTIINPPADENGDRNQSSDCEGKSDAQSIEDDASECADSHAAAADPESGIIGELNTAMEEDL
ncbi:ethionine resistance protein [Coemansia sp. RSA 1804]|nr:ethionine resistance protein [Coemansia sp. RSA 1804]